MVQRITGSRTIRQAAPPVPERSAGSLWALLGLVVAVAVVVALVASGFSAA